MKRLKIYLVFFFLFTFANLVYAEDIPKVDDLNKNFPKLPQKPKELPSDEFQLEREKKTEQATGEQLLKILVKDYIFEGNTKYLDSELKDLIKETFNKELDYYQLIEVTNIITNYYRLNGFLATTYLPPQDIKKGIVKIKITEAKIGKIYFDNSIKEKSNEENLNLPKTQIEKRILHKIDISGILNILQLDKNVRNLNKIPGISVLAQLEEGDNFGETNIKITAVNTNTVSGNTLVDNNGSRSSGYHKMTNSLNFDGLLNFGERVTLTNVLSGDHLKEDNHEESNYYAISSQIPIGYSGMLGTLRISKMEYKLSAPFDSTKPSGYSSEYNLTLDQALIESTNFNFNTSLSLSNNKYVNDLGTGNNSDKDILKSALTFGFDSTDNKFGGGVMYGSFGFNIAKVDLTDNSDNFDNDQTGADTNGRNLKATFNLNRLQRLTEKTNLLVKFNGQLAADNLDGAEQLSLGGPNALKSYPSNEAAGDSGFVSGVELKRTFLKDIESAVFYDYGKIKLHKKLWNNWNSTNTGLKNNYHLQGYGISLSKPLLNSFNINASYSRKKSHNSGRDVSGKDVDGLMWNNRKLISINGQF
tara:strand:- start:1369 stop:3129 length:1761 start_codon:yes stop_codon:yes gene_type:complete